MFWPQAVTADPFTEDREKRLQMKMNRPRKTQMRLEFQIIKRYPSLNIQKCLQNPNKCWIESQDYFESRVGKLSFFFKQPLTPAWLISKLKISSHKLVSMHVSGVPLFCPEFSNIRDRILQCLSTLHLFQSLSSSSVI